MKNIQYTLTFFAPWHCGSGLSSGADLDAVVIKDENGLPFVPGKTIKGLVREAIEVIRSLNGCPNDSTVERAFGVGADSAGSCQGELFFKNCELPLPMKKYILQENLQDYLYDDKASTAIDDMGIAKQGSLRKVEATVPCTLEGEILMVNDDVYPLLCRALMYVKRLGANRNRGWGRCEFVVKEGGEK